MTTDKKICAEETACGVCTFKHNSNNRINRDVFEKLFLLADYEDEVASGGYK